VAKNRSMMDSAARRRLSTTPTVAAGDTVSAGQKIAVAGNSRHKHVVLSVLESDTPKRNARSRGTSTRFSAC
jgi:hypothetical protein